MPTETLPAEDTEAAQKRLNGILSGAVSGKDLEREQQQHVRAPRKDKGTKRPEKPKPAPAGVLTAEQVEKLAGMVEAIIRIQIDQQSLSIKADAVKTEYYAYLLELQGK